VVRHGLGLTGIGVGLGLVGAAVASRGLSALLFGISPHDPATYLGVVVVLGLVALAASAVPAWRAVQVDPAITLRTD
jgi:ABC-type antimicrobial peptide transport system permease subunit